MLASNVIFSKNIKLAKSTKVVFELKHKSIILINSPTSKHNYTVLNMTDVSKCQFFLWCQSSVISLLNIGYLLFCFPGTLSCHGCLGVCKDTTEAIAKGVLVLISEPIVAWFCVWFSKLRILGLCTSFMKGALFCECWLYQLWYNNTDKLKNLNNFMRGMILLLKKYQAIYYYL